MKVIYLAGEGVQVALYELKMQTTHLLLYNCYLMHIYNSNLLLLIMNVTAVVTLKLSLWHSNKIQYRWSTKVSSIYICISYSLFPVYFHVFLYGTHKDKQ